MSIAGLHRDNPFRTISTIDTTTASLCKSTAPNRVTNLSRKVKHLLVCLPNVCTSLPVNNLTVTKHSVVWELLHGHSEDVVAAVQAGDGRREAAAGEGAPVGGAHGGPAVGGRAALLDLHHVLHLHALLFLFFFFFVCFSLSLLRFALLASLLSRVRVASRLPWMEAVWTIPVDCDVRGGEKRGLK
jgi:hypothetical protein